MCACACGKKICRLNCHPRTNINGKFIVQSFGKIDIKLASQRKEIIYLSILSSKRPRLPRTLTILLDSRGHLASLTQDALTPKGETVWLIAQLWCN